MSKATVYALVDPRDLNPRYIGCTKNPEIRYRSHISHALREYDLSITKGKISYCDPSKKAEWIRELHGLGMKPIFQPIAIVPILEGDYWEAFFAEILQDFNLLNTKILSKNFKNPSFRMK